MLGRSIPVVDLTSGRITDRARTTPTLDVPADFDRTACVASVDAHSRAHYLSTAGSTLLNPAHPRPLSWRARGEVFLLASGGGKTDDVVYRLCELDPAPG